MRRPLILLASAALLLAGCAKEQVVGTGNNVDTVEVSVAVAIENAGPQTKASWDNDGNGACVNRWIMEVYDKQGIRFDRQVKTGQSGHTNTFSVILIKGQEYKFAFWADKEGSYDADSLRTVKTVSNVAGLDSRDAFFAVKDYTSSTSGTITAKLYRPFAQINIVTRDLKKLYEQMSAAGTTADYAKFKPKTLNLTCDTYNQFDVLTGSVSDKKTSTLTIDECYADYSAHKDSTTIFMDYLFAGDENEPEDLTFTFKSNEVAINYGFTNIPLQRNYRTNIFGNLLSNDATVNVEIIPTWNEPDIVVPVLPKGVLSGVFSVSADKKVRFSKGNLRAQKVEDSWTWGFYDKQYQCNLEKGTSNRTAKASDSGIDLFTWGYGDWSEDPITTTYESSSFVDWGTAIEGDATWRTLSVAEWQYLINKENASTVRKDKFKCGVSVCGLKNCMILAPDDFAGTIEASYDTESWQAAEAKGLVCLPSAGTRYETDVYFISIYGYYWTSSVNEDNKSLLVSFDATEPFPGIFFSDSPDNGFAVRLVTDTE